MRLSRAWAGLAIALILSAVSAPAAQAHAAYESSDPANGATVSSPPSRVTADFTEPLVDGSRLEVYDPCGERVDNGDSLVAGDRLTVSMSADKRGSYRVHFAVVSSVDGHPTSGDFGFTSSGGAPCPGAEPPEKDPSGGGGGNDGGGAAGRDQGSTGASTSTTSRRTGDDDRSQQDTRPSSSKRSREKEDAGGRRERKKRSGVATERSEGSTEDESQPLAAVSLSDAMNVWEGIPVSGFVVAMLLAAAIGGAGGMIYAGILGPKR